MFSFKKFGKTELIIEGVNIAVLLNEFNKQNIEIIKATKIDTTKTQLYFKNKYLSRIVAILKQKCYNIVQEKHSTEYNFVNNILTRWGLLVGCFLGIILCVISTFFVWNVNIQNDSSKLYNSICKVLKQNGLGKGAFLPAYDCNKAEMVLLENFENLSLVSVSLRGGTLIVDYTLKTSESELENDFDAKNIVAKQDGIVANIVVSSGTPQVKIGDVVTKGQVLIAGYKLDAEGNKVDCVAGGLVTAYVFKSATTQFPLTKLEYVRTDNFVVSNRLYLGDTLISENISTHNFEHYEEESSISYISNIIPLKMQTIIVYETEGIEVKQNFEEQKQSVIDQTRLLALEKCKEDAEIIDESVATNFVADIWFVTYTIQIKEKIS